MIEQRVPDSFVVRIWVEREPNGDPMWRGRIRHVQSEQKAYFQDLEGMSAFLERVSGIPGPGPTRPRAEDAGISQPEVPADRKRRN